MAKHPTFSNGTFGMCLMSICFIFFYFFGEGGGGCLGGSGFLELLLDLPLIKKIK